MKTSATHLIVAVGTILFSHSVIASETERTRFLNEAPASWQRYRSLLNELGRGGFKVRMRMQTMDLRTGETVTDPSTLVQSKNECRLNISPDPRSATEDQRASGRNSRYEFYLRRRPERISVRFPRLISSNTPPPVQNRTATKQRSARRRFLNWTRFRSTNSSRIPRLNCTMSERSAWMVRNCSRCITNSKRWPPMSSPEEDGCDWIRPSSGSFIQRSTPRSDPRTTKRQQLKY